MADYPRASSEGRSANMRAIRRTDTKPELALRRALHAMGYRFRKDYRLDLEGRRVRPDIVFTARKVAVFVDGCFWHACPDHGSKPSVNQGYWNPKLLKNVERDRAADAALDLAGWQVVRLWEHVSLDDAVAAVVATLGPAAPSPAHPDRSHARRMADPATHDVAMSAPDTGPEPAESPSLVKSPSSAGSPGPSESPGPAQDSRAHGPVGNA